MNILVFGGNGFIGRSITYHLKNRDTATINIVNRTDLDFHDLTNSVLSKLDNFKPDTIIYSAGFNRRFIPQEVELLNEHKVLSILSRFDGKLIYLSSSLVYSPLCSNLSISESHPVAPSGDYGFFKAICEDIVSTHHDWNILRLSSIVGKGKKESVFQFIINHARQNHDKVVFKFSDSSEIICI